MGPFPAALVALRLRRVHFKIACYRTARISSAVLRRSVAQLFMVGIPGPTLDVETRAFLEEYAPGGVVRLCCTAPGLWLARPGVR